MEERVLLANLPPMQRAYVVARSHSPNKTEAFASSGLHRWTYYRLAHAERTRLEWLAEAIRAERAQALLAETAAEAVETLRGLLKSADEAVRLKAAVQILDRALGKPVNRLDMTSGGQAVKMYGVVSPDDWDTAA